MSPTTYRRPPRHPRPAGAPRRGVTLFGLLFWAILIGFAAYMLVRAVPTVIEYGTILRTVSAVAATNPSTVPEARAAFDRQKDVDAITSISGKDLTITKENDKVVVAFAYDKQLPIFGPVYLLIKYEGRSR